MKKEKENLSVFMISYNCEERNATNFKILLSLHKSLII